MSFMITQNGPWSARLVVGGTRKRPTLDEHPVARPHADAAPAPDRLYSFPVCCFSRSVPFVGRTRIFARHAPAGRQRLVYAMDVELAAETAMVLPLPVPVSDGPPADDALHFINLEGYADFFEDLAAAFPDLGAKPASRGFDLVRAAPQTLVVHDVGLFEASFVPSRADFARLDERFRLPPAVWDALPQYADWGFAVFRLKPKKGLFGRVRGGKRQSVHPMAFSFPTREPSALYFPTVHVHDGAVHPRATFDHALYAQADGVLEATLGLGWSRSVTELGARVDAARAQDVVDGRRGGFATALLGERRNDDVWL